MRVAFLGTPEAAVPTLEALTSVVEIAVIVTRPDRPRGRSRRLVSPPVKRAAQVLGHTVAQPTRAAELAEVLAEHAPLDVGVVVAFGMILPADILAIPNRGFVNLHFSLLPRWRGAAPVERAIMAGDHLTGVSIMAMDTGLDTGDVIASQEVEIGATESGGRLTGRLALIGAALLADTLEPWVAGRISSTPQPESGVSYAAKVVSSDRLLTPSMTQRAFVDTTRALAPEPGAQLEIFGELHKILAASPAAGAPTPGEWAELGGSPMLGVADGAVTLDIIQPPGRRAMPGSAWLRGRRLPGR